MGTKTTETCSLRADVAVATGGCPARSGALRRCSIQLLGNAKKFSHLIKLNEGVNNG